MTRNLYVGVTDYSWLEFLSDRPNIGEVNFWRPGGDLLRPLPGAPFLFKLKKPFNAIAGVAFFELAERMTISDAWEFYGEANGVGSAEQLLSSIRRNRQGTIGYNHTIGCVILSQPTFFPQAQWIPQPPEWKSSTQVAKTFDIGSGAGARLWQTVVALLGDRIPQPQLSVLAPFGGISKPALYLPRQGQGTFRRLVLSAYDSR
mgnify:CR=1 FL=1